MLELYPYKNLSSKDLSRKLSKLKDVRVVINGDNLVEAKANTDRIVRAFVDDGTFDKYKLITKETDNRIKEILKFADREVSLRFVVNKRGIIVSSPINLTTLNLYDIYPAIEVTDSDIVVVDYSELADLISYEYMCYEFGETFDSIEKKLEDINVYSVYKYADILERLPKIKGSYNRVYMKCTNSIYYDKNENKLLTYLGGIEVDPTVYYTAVEVSLRLIMAEILNTVLTYQKRFELIGIGNKSICVRVTEGNTEEVKEWFSSKFKVTVFGRKVYIIPDIKVY